MSYVSDPPGFLVRLARRYGDVARFRLATRDVYLVTRPEYVREVLVTQQSSFPRSEIYARLARYLGHGVLTMEGDEHRRERRLIQPAFHRGLVGEFAAGAIHHAAAARDCWRGGVALDVAAEMNRLTLQALVDYLLPPATEEARQSVARAATDYLDRVRPAVVPGAPAGYVPFVLNRRALAARGRLLECLLLVQERPGDGDARVNLLALLCEARRAGVVTERQVWDEMLSMLVAGHETVATGLAWTWHLLAQHPKAEACFLAEVDAVLGGRTAELEDVERMPYVRMVFAEAMRLYPPVWAFSRRTTQPHRFGEHVVPAGALVMVSPFVTQRDPRSFAEPERFIPERWAEHDPRNATDCAYFPFLAGAHRCMGEALAWVEASLVLATLGQVWRLRPEAGPRVGYQPSVALRPRGGLWMVPERRAGRQPGAPVPTNHRAAVST